MNISNPMGVLRRFASQVLASCALLAASSAAMAQITVDTVPPEPRAGDYITLQISGAFPRHDFWVTDAVLWDLYPAPGGSPREFIADVEVYYHWKPLYTAPLSRNVFTANVGLGQFDTAATVEVRVRFYPQPGLPAAFDPTEFATFMLSVGSGRVTCGNELVLGSATPSCVPALDFGTYRFGERSIEIPLVIRNAGREVVHFGNFLLDNADYGMTRTCGEALEPGQACEVLVTFSPSFGGASPGHLAIPHADHPQAIPFRTAVIGLAGRSPVTVAQAPGAGMRVVEYHAPSVDQYFLTANENEMAALDRGSDWRRTGVTFLASGDQEVCRFYGDLAAGPNGHFYTARVDVCDALKLRANITPFGREAYRYETIAFPMGLPLMPLNDGRWRCPEGSRAIYQFKRPAQGGRHLGYRLVPAGSVQGGPNGDDIARTMLQSGWAYEGHVMCSVPPVEATP